MSDFIHGKSTNPSTVIKFTNIDSEDFTHAYDGYPWTVKTGESQFFPANHARLFAKHLARKILMRVKKATSEGKMDGAILFREDDMSSLMTKILTESVDLPSNQQTPQEVYRQRVDEVNKTLNTNLTPSSTEMSKAEIIDKLTEKKISFDGRLGKDKLLELLNAS